MGREPIEISFCSSEEESWNTILKWSWFTRDVWASEHWERTKHALQPVFSFLSKLRVKSILDCSCGLGFKTVMFAKMGYKVEGSDASTIAIKYAPKLAKEQGLRIKFFRSRYEELGKNCNHRYDCVYSDYFDEIENYKTLKASAKGIYSVLENDGKFIFYSPPQKYIKKNLKNLIEKEWQKRKRLEIELPVERDGLRIIHIEIPEKTHEGVLENHIYLIEESGRVRGEIAFIMNSRIKWTFQDFVKVLKEANFRKIESIH